ncbi:hypothetical protein GOV13_02130 [Candidatus Pacearchaeota archaeon]|nr:hypothetical protein [Candidatus Pacearchaeota archaeon]
MRKITSKKAAMEMSVGTIVTIVLLMTVLILGLVLVRSIFSGAIKNIEGIDSAVESEIQKLFAESNTKKIVIIPSTREVEIKKGEDTRGFGFSIRNIGESADRFSYSISAEEASCDIRLSEAEDLIALGKDKNNIQIPAGDIMEYPTFIKFGIPETFPPCKITYAISMEKGTKIYGSSVEVYLTVTSK